MVLAVRGAGVPPEPIRDQALPGAVGGLDRPAQLVADLVQVLGLPVEHAGQALQLLRWCQPRHTGDDRDPPADGDMVRASHTLPAPRHLTVVGEEVTGVRAMDGVPVPTNGVVPGLGPYPDGDPEAIRALAAELRRTAGTLTGVPRPSIADWQSPAAARVRSRLVAAAGGAGRIGGDLRGLAAALESAAHTLEADQREWRLAKRRLSEREDG